MEAKTDLNKLNVYGFNPLWYEIIANNGITPKHDADIIVNNTPFDLLIAVFFLQTRWIFQV